MNYSVIDENFLQQIEMLHMLVKNNVAGLFGGTHKSKNYGSSCEFEDYRDYMPGDDITKIDWNVYARTENLYQKLYLDERQMHTRIYIDASRSMNFGSGDKARQAIRLAAMLAYISVAEMDKVSIYVIRDKQVDVVVKGIVGKSAYLNHIGALNEIEFDGDTYISDALLPTGVGYGDGMSGIIWDFLTDNDFEGAINHLADKRRDVLCIQVLSRAEINPQIRGKVLLFDSESANRTYRKNVTRDIARAYKEALQYTKDKIKNTCAARGASYIDVTAEDELADVLFSRLVGIEVLK